MNDRVPFGRTRHDSGRRRERGARALLDRRVGGTGVRMTLQQVSAYLLLLLMPLSVALPLVRPLRNGIHWLFVTPAIEPADLPALLLVLLTWLQPRHALRQRGRAGLAAILAALAALGLLSTVESWLPSLAVSFTLRWALAAAVCWALVASDLRPERLVAVLVLGLSVQSLIAIDQVILQGPLGLPGELALPPNALGASSVWLGSRNWVRGYGLTFHPNVLGGFLAVGLILALPLLNRPLARFAWWLMSLALLSTFSRSALLAAALILPLVVLWLWRHDRRLRQGLAITLGVAVCALSGAGWVWRGPIGARLGVQPPDAAVSSSVPASMLEQLKRDPRLPLNAIALHLIAEHPLLGIGAGNSPLAVKREHPVPHYPHNVALMLGAEVGVGGAVLWLALLGVALWRMRHAPSPVEPWLVAGVGALAVLQIIGLLDCYPWSLNAGRMLTVTVLALIETTSRRDRRE